MIDSFGSYKLLALIVRNGQYFWDIRNEGPMSGAVWPCCCALTVVLRLRGQLLWRDEVDTLCNGWAWAWGCVDTSNMWRNKKEEEPRIWDEGSMLLCEGVDDRNAVLGCSKFASKHCLWLLAMIEFLSFFLFCFLFWSVFGSWICGGTYGGIRKIIKDVMKWSSCIEVEVASTSSLQ